MKKRFLLGVIVGILLVPSLFSQRILFSDIIPLESYRYRGEV